MTTFSESAKTDAIAEKDSAQPEESKMSIFKFDAETPAVKSESGNPVITVNLYTDGGVQFNGYKILYSNLLDLEENIHAAQVIGRGMIAIINGPVDWEPKDVPEGQVLMVVSDQDHMPRLRKGLIRISLDPKNGDWLDIPQFESEMQVLKYRI